MRGVASWYRYVGSSAPPIFSESPGHSWPSQACRIFSISPVPITASTSGICSRMSLRKRSTMQPATINFCARPNFLYSAISRMDSTDSFCAGSMKLQVLTTSTSASPARGVSSYPARARMPIITSLSTRFFGHPRLTNPTFFMQSGPLACYATHNSNIPDALFSWVTEERSETPDQSPPARTSKAESRRDAGATKGKGAHPVARDGRYKVKGLAYEHFFANCDTDLARGCFSGAGEFADGAQQRGHLLRRRWPVAEAGGLVECG